MLSRPYRVIPLLAERIYVLALIGVFWHACPTPCMCMWEQGHLMPNMMLMLHIYSIFHIFFLLPSITIVHLGPWDSVVSILHLFICLCEFLGPLHLNPKGSKNKIPQFSSSTTMYQKTVHRLPLTLTHAKPTQYWIPLLIRFSQVRTFPHTVGQIEKTPQLLHASIIMFRPPQNFTATLPTELD